MTCGSFWTAAFIIAIESPERLSRRAAAVLDNTENTLLLSAISLTEIAINVSSGKLNLPSNVVRESIVDLDLRLLSFTAEHAFQLFGLPLHHRDPFDRQLIAQAMSEEIPILSPDRAFNLYELLKTIW